jgi:hypothetical protein
MVVNDFALASGLSRYVVLLPALLVGFGLVGGILILLGRAFAETVRESRHPRLIVGGLVALTGAVILLTYLGVELPRE